ncbi:MAG: hypothetical protein RBR49_07410 [Desulfovibrio desulfuricans]|nr:hypothetical protein [Desulfovibrio desulfuricans]
MLAVSFAVLMQKAAESEPDDVDRAKNRAKILELSAHEYVFK